MTRQELYDWIKNEYGTEPEYLWEKFPGYAVFRNSDNKWFAIIMDVARNKFGLESNEIVNVLNVKADMVMIDVLVSQPGFYRAYHMNKNQWMSVFLDGTVPDEEIKNLIADSYDKTSRKAKQIRKN